jgi:hypothetical protein
MNSTDLCAVLLPIRRVGAWLLVAALGVLVFPQTITSAPAQEFRVVFATRQTLSRQLDAAGRDGYRCLLMAHADSGVSAPGIVVWLARNAGATPSPTTYRVFMGAADLQAPLERSGGEGFRLCGIALSEEAPLPTIVAVMNRPAGEAPTRWHYRTEALLNYKDSLTRLNAGGREGYVPVAAAAMNNNRVPALRNWMVVTERGESDAVLPREVVVTSDPGADGFQKKLNERGRDGYRVNLQWKEGNDFVALSSRPVGISPTPLSYAASADRLTNLHALSRLYLADFPYLQDRLIVSDASITASNEVVDDALPALGAYPDMMALDVLASHISRNTGFVPASARISRASNGQWRLTTVIVSRKD